MSLRPDWTEYNSNTNSIDYLNETSDICLVDNPNRPQIPKTTLRSTLVKMSKSANKSSQPNRVCWAYPGEPGAY